ncbi:sulfite exporter TauE/SafE family protein [bacterium]|nr:sulfite exporter TauE/SafE family protein [bacterium]
MEFPLTVIDSLLAFGIAFLGSTLQGSVGFGLGLIGVPLLVLINPIFVPGPLLLSALTLTLLICYREHQSIDVKGIQWAIPGRIVGSVLGAALLTLIPRENLSLLFGGMVLLAIGISLMGWEVPLTSLNLFGAGTVSGFMGTTSSIGGAPIALIYQREKGSRLRGTLSGIFVFGTIISILSLVVIGHFGLQEMLIAVVLIPGVILGFFLSSQTAKILDKGFTRPAVLIASALSGSVVIIRSILGF